MARPDELADENNQLDIEVEGNFVITPPPYSESVQPIGNYCQSSSMIAMKWLTNTISNQVDVEFVEDIVGSPQPHPERAQYNRSFNYSSLLTVNEGANENNQSDLEFIEDIVVIRPPPYSRREHVITSL